MIYRLVAENTGQYLIVVRDDDVWVDEPRADDLAILVDTSAGFRRPPWPLHRYLAHMPGWEDCGHDDVIVEQFMSLPERTARPVYVDFLQTQDNGSQQIIFTVELIDGRPEVTRGDKAYAESLGIPTRDIQGEGGKLVSPSDGIEYMRALRFAFSGSRLRATDVKE